MHVLHLSPEPWSAIAYQLTVSWDAKQIREQFVVDCVKASQYGRIY